MKERVVLLYPAGRLLTGQRFASEILTGILKGLNIRAVVIETPALNRTDGGHWAELVWLLRALWAWIRCLCQLPYSANLHIALGQTYFGFLREGLPYLVLALRNRNNISVISLNGSVFLGWEPQHRINKLFLKLVGVSNYITCLGQRQREHLIHLGVPKEKIKIVYNAVHDVSGLFPVSDSLEVLYLSNLMQTKGYDTFLKAIQLVSETTEIKVDVKLVGKPLDDGSGMFNSNDEAIEWIEGMIREINSSTSVSIEWIQGAYGSEKDQLFSEASVFVFPTRYHVEAQPIVLLEAMAAGCAVITTRMGEIPEALGEAAVYVDAEDAEQLAAEIITMLEDSSLRLTYAGRARNRYESHFSIKEHASTWANIYGFPVTE